MRGIIRKSFGDYFGLLLDGSSCYWFFLFQSYSSQSFCAIICGPWFFANQCISDKWAAAFPYCLSKYQGNPSALWLLFTTGLASSYAPTYSYFHIFVAISAKTMRRKARDPRPIDSDKSWSGAAACASVFYSIKFFAIGIVFPALLCEKGRKRAGRADWRLSSWVRKFPLLVRSLLSLSGWKNHLRLSLEHSFYIYFYSLWDHLVKTYPRPNNNEFDRKHLS